MFQSSYMGEWFPDNLQIFQKANKQVTSNFLSTVISRRDNRGLFYFSVELVLKEQIHVEWTYGLRQTRNRLLQNKCSSALKQNTQVVFLFCSACLENCMCKPSFFPGQRNGRYTTITISWQCSEQVLNKREPKMSLISNMHSKNQGSLLFLEKFPNDKPIIYNLEWIFPLSFN